MYDIGKPEKCIVSYLNVSYTLGTKPDLNERRKEMENKMMVLIYSNCLSSISLQSKIVFACKGNSQYSSWKKKRSKSKNILFLLNRKKKFLGQRNGSASGLILEG